MIKLVCSDLDGTLLPSTNASVAAEDMAAIEALLDNGVAFMPVSGRQFCYMMNLFQPLSDRLDYVAENGTLIFHRGKLVYKDVMPRDLALKLLSLADSRPEYGILVSGVDHAVIKGDNERFVKECLDFCNIFLEIVDDLTCQDEYFKISLWKEEREGILEDCAAWQEMFKDELTVVYAGNGWIDFSVKGATKGKALNWYMTHYQMTPDEVMMFGDNYNDETALQAVTYSYAMVGAPADIKDQCFGVTASVRETLKRHFDFVK